MAAVVGTLLVGLNQGDVLLSAHWVSRVPAGRHALTARAADALGRWAGVSVIVDISPADVAPDTAA